MDLEYTQEELLPGEVHRCEISTAKTATHTPLKL